MQIMYVFYIFLQFLDLIIYKPILSFMWKIDIYTADV